MLNARSAPPFSPPADALLNETPIVVPEMTHPALRSQSPTVTLAIPAVSDYVRVARLAVTGVASRMRFSYDQIEDIKLAVSEACNNAILHATPATSAEPQTSLVWIQLMPLPDRLEIVVADHGNLEPPGLVLEPPVPIAPKHADDASELPESGLGLMLIQSLMDEVSTHGGGEHTVLHMVKHLRPL